MLPAVLDYGALFRASPYPFLLISRDLIILAANPAYEVATGRRADELEGKHIFDAFPANPADPDSTNMAEVRASIEIAVATKKPHKSTLLRYAVPIISPTGTTFSERYWSAVHSPVFSADGEVAFVCQNALDVTELYEFDEKIRRYRLRPTASEVPDTPMSSNPQIQVAMTRILKDERNHLQLLFDQAPGFIAVMSGAEHAITMVNESFCKLVGRHDLIGLPIVQALPEIQGQGWMDQLTLAFETGRPIVMKSRQVLLQRTVGAPLAEIYVDLVLQPIFGSDGRVTGIFAQGHEVTQTFQANRSLALKVTELEEARVRQTFELQLADMLKTVATPREMMQRACELLEHYLGAVRIMQCEYDEQRRVLVFHDQDATGAVHPLTNSFKYALLDKDFQQSMERGLPWAYTERGADSAASAAELSSMLRALDIRACVIVPLEANGHMKPCLFIASPQPRPWDGRTLALINAAAERTWSAIQRARAEEGLRLANQRKDEFLAMLAHELRNPLAPISAAASILKMKDPSPDMIARTSEVIARQVKHMTGLVDDLLDVSRVSTGLVVLEKTNVDFKQVICDAVEQARPLIEARQHSITDAITMEDTVVLGDHKRLVQVTANLLTNAAKYTTKGGRIKVTLEASPQWVTLSVQDSGVGIDSALLPQIFTLFTQAQRTPDRSMGGLGLGLALVRSLVDLHGGSVSAYSEGLNMGSLFTMRLPRANESQPSGSPRPESFPAPSDHDRRVMVVDDNIDAAHMMGIFLEASGYAVDVEHDPGQALEHARTRSYGAFLLDIGLPGMDGNELARQLRTLPNHAGATLVAITGYGDKRERDRSLRAGFDHYLTKPADSEEILTILQNCL